MTAVTTQQVDALLDRAHAGRCTSDEQRLLARLLERSRATTASLRADLRHARATAGGASAVACDTCGATPGQPCTSILTGGTLTAPHTARIWTARKAAR